MSTTDVANCIGWAAGLGIRWITVWDVDGTVSPPALLSSPHSPSRVRLFCLSVSLFLVNACAQHVGTLTHDHICTHSGKLKRDSARLEKFATVACAAEGIEPVEYRVGGVGHRGRTEGVPTNPDCGVVITVLSQCDGRSDIAHAARGVAGAYRRGELEDSDLNKLYPDGFAGWLGVDLPQLDLVFKCGEIDALAGLLPWHISVAEIIKFGSHHGIQKEGFISGMGVFAGSDRRFGR